MELPTAPAGLAGRRRRRAGALQAGVLAAALAVGPGCGLGSEPGSSSGGGAGILSEEQMAVFSSLPPIESEERSPAEATAAFMAFDANGDGALEADELSSQMQSLIARADADADGMASEPEILALLTREAAETAEIADSAETP